MSDEWLGVALPWGPDIKSFIEPKEDAEVIRTSVLFILLTGLGERVMLNAFGSLLPGAVFEQNDPALQAELQASVSEALARWDDRVELVFFEALRDELNENQLNIKVIWKNVMDPISEETQMLEIPLSLSALSEVGG